MTIHDRRSRASCREGENASHVLKGRVVGIKKGAAAAQVRLDIGGGNVITSMNTVDAVDDLGTKQGDQISVVIKSAARSVAAHG